jgi:hypothetical protein
MEKIEHQFLTDVNGTKKAVIIPLDEWQKLMDELEELDDIKAYDQAKTSPSSPVPFEEAIKQISRETSN